MRHLQLFERFATTKQDYEVTSIVREFLDALTPDDIGSKEFDGLVVYYEGFTADCWVKPLADIAKEEKKEKTDETPEQTVLRKLETEIISDWATRLAEDRKIMKSLVVEDGWLMGEAEPGEDNIFYAIFRDKGKN